MGLEMVLPLRIRMYLAVMSVAHFPTLQDWRLTIRMLSVIEHSLVRVSVGLFYSAGGLAGIVSSAPLYTVSQLMPYNSSVYIYHGITSSVY